MRDQIDARLWAEHHEGFSDHIGQLVDTVRVSLNKLHAIQFDAPWRRSGGPKTGINA